MLKRVLLAAALFGFTFPAHSQVIQSGSVTPGHVVTWTTNGVVQDGGTAAAPTNLTSVGILSNGGPALCATSSVITGPYNQLCFAVSTSAPATISLQNYGGAPSETLNFSVNGINYPFPGSLSTITLGTTPVNGGTNGLCLVISGTVVGQQSCSVAAITALTGDVTASGPNSAVATLATVNPDVGTFGSTVQIPVITVNGKGLITAVSTAPVATVAANTLTGTTLATNVVNSSLTGLGTIATGVWQGTLVGATYGGTGVNNGLATLTLSAALTTTGTGTPTLTFPNTTGYTYTFQGSSDTMVGRATTDTLTNKTLTAPAIAGGALSGTFSGTPTLSGANFVTLANIVQDPTGYSLLGNTASGSANYVPFAIGALTQKVSPAGTDLILIQDQAASGQLKYATVSAVAAGATVASVNTATGAVVLLMAPQGRLTLQTGMPVMSSSSSPTSVIYYDNYRGNQVPYYNGSVDAVDVITGGEVSTTMQTSGTGVTNSGGVFDVWWDHNGGSPLICVATNGSGGGWASDTGGSNTTRGTGYTQLNAFGRPYITNANTISHCYNGSSDAGSIAANKATYLGSFFTSGAGLTEYVLGSSAAGGGAAYLYLWNAYNRVSVATTVTDSNSSWNYALAPIRNSDGSANNRISFVSGMAEDSVSVSFMDAGTNANATAFVGIGFSFDNFGTNIYDKGGFWATQSTNDLQQTETVINNYPPQVGMHYVQAQESTDGTTTATFIGTNRYAFSMEWRM